MSGFNSQGVGAAACANAGVVSAAGAAATTSAAAIKSVLVENLVILHSPSYRSEGGISFLNKPRTPFSRQYGEPFRRSKDPRDFVISRFRLRDYVRVSG